MGESYFNLEPTLSMDYAPNNQEKIYNTLRLSYIKDESTGRMRDYAEAKCILQIPKLVKISKKPAGLNTQTSTEQEVVTLNSPHSHSHSHSHEEPEVMVEMDTVESCHSHDDIN